MRKIRVLWLSNVLLDEKEPNATGTWLHAMSEALLESGQVELGNITAGKVKQLNKCDYGPIAQWMVTYTTRLNRQGLPAESIVSQYLTAIKEFNPDIIHVWGVENYPALITAKNATGFPTLLEIQGICGAIAQFVEGGLSREELFRCIGIREILLKSSVFQVKALWNKWGVFEKKMMSGHEFITVPSTWMKAQAKAVNPEATYFQNEIPLRRDFFSARTWEFSGKPIIFCSASSSMPFKGFHIVVKSLEILKKSYPEVQLRIAGGHQKKGIRRNGYIHWLTRQIEKIGLTSNIQWLGPLNSKQLSQELSNASVAVFPSFVESYGVAHAEAMVVGAPCVCAFNGGSSYLAEDGKTALFFQAGDHVVCAYQINRLLSERELAESISKNAREIAFERHDIKKIVQKQISIYKSILDKEESYSG